MKKQYGKPVVTFENFSFSSNFAAGCGDLIGLQSANANCLYYATFKDGDTCAFVDNGYPVFYSATTGCYTGPQGDYWGALCYHQAGENSRMFSS